MISFKAFVVEQVRTPDQALKLGTYLTKRYDRKYPNANAPYKKISLKDDQSSYRAWKAYNAASSQAPDKQLFTKNKKVAIRHIKFTQNHVEFNAGYAAKHPNGLEHDTRPVKLIKNKGRYYVIDGHHRLMNRKLLGHTHINAKVFDPNE